MNLQRDYDIWQVSQHMQRSPSPQNPLKFDEEEIPGFNRDHAGSDKIFIIFP
jgi:hypothetical protein